MTEEVKNEESSTQVASPDPEKVEEQTSPEAGQETNESEELEGTVEPEGSQIDYKAEYEKQKKQLGKAEFTIEKLKKKKKKKAIEPRPAPIDTSKIVQKEVRKQMAAQNEDFIDETIESITDNEDERRLIKFHYKNSLNPTGFSRSAIKNDLLNAHAMANRGRLQKENQELKLANKAKNTMQIASQGGNQPSKQPSNTDNLGEGLSKEVFERFKKVANGNPEKLKKLVAKYKHNESVGDIAGKVPLKQPL